MREVTPPVQTPLGFHLIRVDSKKGDTLSLRHILVRIEMADTSAARIDKEADKLASAAASSEQGAKLDTAARNLKLPITRLQVIEDEPAVSNGRPIPSVSAWAFGGAKRGESSELFDDEGGFYLARLDSIQPGGEPKFENVKEMVRARVAAERQLEKLMPQAQQFATAAANTSLEAAAQQAGKKVEQTPLFTRSSLVPGLGQFTEPIGAAFALPVAAVSQPIKSPDGVFVIRVDKRVLADSAAWAAQKVAQRQTRLEQLRQQQLPQMFLQDLRKAAKIEDRRKQINAAKRREA